MVMDLRKQCLYDYEHDESYKEWYDHYFLDNGVVIPIKELMDITTPILDINGIVNDSKTDRGYYDQELDNQFISGENRAIGEFREEDVPTADLAKILRDYKKEVLEWWTSQWKQRKPLVILL